MATAFGHLVSPEGQLLAKGKNPIQNCFREMADVVVAGIANFRQLLSIKERLVIFY
jgi:hypothetical protein